MLNFLDAEPIEVAFGIPGEKATTDPMTGNTYPGQESEIVDCVIVPQSGKQGESIIQEFPGADKSAIAVYVWPKDGQWGDEVRRQSPAKGSLLWQGKPASLMLKVAAPADGRIAGFADVLGDKAIGIVTIGRKSSSVEI